MSSFERHPSDSRSTQYVYFFGGGRAEGRGDLKDVLGGKGAGLAEMTNAGVPVPPGFTITTEVCRHYYAHGRTLPADFDAQQKAALERLEKAMGKGLGDPHDPLLVSVRSGAKFSMPGMMDTILNLGLNDRSVAGLAKKTGNARFAWDCYRRFIAHVRRRRAGHRRRTSSSSSSPRSRPSRRAEARHRPDAPRTWRRWSPSSRPSCASALGPATSRRIRTTSSPGARDAVFRSWMNDRALYLPQAEPHPRRPRHRRQRAGHGVRQPGRRLRHRRRLHAQPGDRREASSTAST